MKPPSPRLWWAVLWAFALLATLAAAPSPQGATPPPQQSASTPTPGPIESCFTEGLVECVPRVVQAFGLPGLLILASIGLLIYLFLVPAGQLLQEKFQEWLRQRLSKPRPLPPAEAQDREEDYVKQLDQSPALNLQADPTEQIAAYLTRLETSADPLHPTEEKEFVPLQGGLGLDLKPRLGLSLPTRSNTGQIMFTEQHTFPDLSTAMDEIDPETAQPYPALALLGEPGSGKSTLLRKLARDAVRKRVFDPSAPVPLFVTLSRYKTGSPEVYLRGRWKDAMGFDGLVDALDDGRVLLFADGLNEMDRRNYDARIRQWREFLRRHFQPGRNRAVVACRVADYGEGLDLPRLLIHPMDEQRIRDFLSKRIPGRDQALWDELERDRREGRGDLYRLAAIPFWLVMMAGVSGRQGLPRNRTMLLDRFISIWLDYEGTRPGGCVLSRSEQESFLQGLTRLAWHGLSKSQNYTFTEKEALKQLASPVKDGTLSSQKILELAQSCSLLNPDAMRLRFQHQLFQEYFSARELARRFSKGKHLTRFWRVPWRRWRYVRSRWDPLPAPPLTGWEEATVLAAGMLEQSETERLALDVVQHNPPLAARCVIESGVAISANIQQAVASQLQAQAETPRHRLSARLAAGKSLGRLGDKRILKG